MFAYVDETGNTGGRLLDDDQPLFITAALLTRSDFDKRFGGEVKAIAASIGVEEIHANQLGIAKIEELGSAILKVVRKAGPSFFLARVEKKYVITSKIFDTIFDCFENKAVPWQVYNIRPLRMMMVFKLAAILDDDLAQQFWDALLEKNEVKARESMAAFCKALKGNVPNVVDQRSRDIINDALDWVVLNPEGLDFVHQTKIGRKGHMPNMVGFGNLLAGIERQSGIWGRPVEVIKHDRQHEFAPALKFWHEMYSNALPGAVNVPFGEKLVLRKVFGSQLEIASARESAGIQIIDVILWLFARTLRGDVLPEKCQALLDYVYSRAYQDDFSFVGVGSATEAALEDIYAQPLSADALERAREFQIESEERRLAAIENYAMEKNATKNVDEVHLG